MKDFTYWHNEIQTAMRITVLEEIGKGIAETQSQTDVFERTVKLAPEQVAELRKLYRQRMDKLKKDRGPQPFNPGDKP